MSDNNNFVKELQVQCLQDAAEHVNDFRSGLVNLSKDSENTLGIILKTCHSLKGNLQAVGFLHCADFVHQLETHLARIQEPTKKGNFAEQDTQVLEFFLSDILQALEYYFSKLRESYEDKEEYKNSVMYSLKILGDWTYCAPLIEKAVSTAPVVDPHADFTLDWPEKLADTTEQSLPKEMAAAQEVKTAAEIIPLPTLDKTEAAPKEVVAQNIVPEVKAEVIPITSALASPTPTTSTPATVAPAKEEESNVIQMHEHQPEEVSKKNKQFLLCMNQGRHFAIRIESVTEIIRSKKLTELPSQRDDMYGIINLRGEVLPVLNLSSVLNVRDNVSNSAKFILVCRILESTFCFGMEEASEVVMLDEGAFQPANDLIRNASTNLVNQYYLESDRMIMILDLEKAIAA